jgi:NaMN:DMB phosphoribosyltransferase
MVNAVTEKRRAVLATAKDAESQRAQVHFDVLTSEDVWAAVAVANQTTPAPLCSAFMYEAGLVGSMAECKHELWKLWPW